MEFNFKDCEVKRMSLTDLRPAEYNPRSMSDKAYDGLGKSLGRFGVLIPIVWNKRSGTIVGGHQRYRHLVDSGETETDVVVVDLEDHEEVALNITLNNPSVRGDFTKDVMGLLRKSEVQLGNTFHELGLFDLHAELRKRIKEPKPPSNSGVGGDGDGGGGGDYTPDPEAPDALITCPECNSRWRMKDNAVVFDGTKGQPADDC